MTDPYPSPARRREAARLGMMIFLSSELMLFGALLAAALALFVHAPGDVAATSTRLNMWLGCANTAVLLTSSLLVAIGVEVRERRPRLTAALFALAALLGCAFLGVKAVEYAAEWREGLMPGTAYAAFDSGAARLFMSLYFIATGLHALHLSIGIALLTGIAARLRWREPPTAASIENAGLYWHLVDVIWVFLYPVLYLTRT